MTYILKITQGALVPQSCERVEDCSDFSSAYFVKHTDLLLECPAYIIVGDVQFYNISSLLRDLHLPESTSTLHILKEAFIKWGHNCVDHFIGDFSFVIYNKSNGEIFSARDHIGIKPLYFFSTISEIILSNCPLSITKTSHHDFPFSHTNLLHFLSQEILPLSKTLFEDIERMPAAQFLSGTAEDWTLKVYWELSSTRRYTAFKNDQECIKQFRELLFEAVRCRIDSNNTACELSGGLDSSTIAAIASKFTNTKKIHTYSNCLSDSDREYREEDEKYLIEELVERYGFQHHFLTDQDENLVDVIQDNLKLYPYPLSYQTTVASRIFKQAQEEGSKVIFSGFGGDECISYRHIPTVIYEHLQNFHWSTAFTELKLQGQFTARSLFKYMIKAYVPQLLQIIRPREMYPYEANPYLNSSFLDQWLPSVKHPPYFTNTQNRSIYQLTQRSDTTDRLESFSLLATTYGIEYRFPLLDIRLLEFFLNLPPKYKCSNGIGRDLLRQSTKDILPDSIRLRSDKSVSECPSFMKLILNSIEAGNIPTFDPNFTNAESIESALNCASPQDLHNPNYLFQFHFPPVLTYQLFLNQTKKQ